MGINLYRYSPVPLPPADEPATSPANRGVLFTHTYFRQMEQGNRAFVCGREGGVNRKSTVYNSSAKPHLRNNDNNTNTQ
jgi:hypothetical protein